MDKTASLTISELSRRRVPGPVPELGGSLGAGSPLLPAEGRRSLQPLQRGFEADAAILGTPQRVTDMH